MLSRFETSAVVGFLLTHIPVTLFIDSQAVLPQHLYPETAKKLFQWYLSTFKDPLCSNPPPWFKTLIWQELLLQLPFFVLGAYAYARGRVWIRKPAIVYGISTATTLVPILGEILTTNGEHNKYVMLGFYLPYLLFPLAIGLRMLVDEAPFARRRTQRPGPQKER